MAEAWTDIGGKVKGAPSLVVAEQGGKRTLFVAARGADDALVWNELVADRDWSGWKSAGGKITSSPSCVAPETGLIKCFVRGKDGFLLMRSYHAERWSDWKSPYEWYFRLSGPPVAIYTTPLHGTVLAAGVPAIFGTQNSIHSVRMLTTRGTKPEEWSDGWSSNWSWAPLSGNTLFDCDAIPVKPYDPRDVTWVRKIAVMNLGSYQVCLLRDPLDGSLNYTYKYGGRRFDGVEMAMFAYVDLKRAPATAFAPDVLLARKELGELQITVTLTASDGSLRRGLIAIADNKPGQRTGGGDPWVNLGGRLSSAPSCRDTYCAGQGADGGVHILDLSTK